MNSNRKMIKTGSNEKVKMQFFFCHRLPERSFFWKGKQFPVCARCTGIHLGYLSMPFFLFNIVIFNVWAAIGMTLLTYIDGFTQAYFDRESNNLLRFSTGLISGIGTMSLTAIFGKWIGVLILQII